MKPSRCATLCFLIKYFKANEERHKVKIIQNYESLLIELKTQKVYNDNVSIESVVNDFILDENTHKYLHLVPLTYLVSF